MLFNAAASHLRFPATGGRYFVYQAPPIAAEIRHFFTESQKNKGR